VNDRSLGGEQIYERALTAFTGGETVHRVYGMGAQL
jgi:hypothetical protein